MIQTIVFDFGGVIATIDGNEAKNVLPTLVSLTSTMCLILIVNKESLVIWKRVN